MERDLRPAGWQRKAKRALDLVVGAGLLAISAPLFAAIGAAVLADAGRPVFFRQERAGERGRIFRIWKFRSMHQVRHDPGRPGEAVTRTGRWLRASGLDELPQLINVVKGEMSLVGPRPTLPEQVAQYDDRERIRLAVPPGLTGWAQIHGRNSLTWPERIELDIWYVRHFSLRLDLLILLRTPLALVTGGGVYGSGGVNDDFRGAAEPINQETS